MLYYFAYYVGVDTKEDMFFWLEIVESLRFMITTYFIISRSFYYYTFEGLLVYLLYHIWYDSGLKIDHGAMISMLISLSAIIFLCNFLVKKLQLQKLETSWLPKNWFATKVVNVTVETVSQLVWRSATRGDFPKLPTESYE